MSNTASTVIALLVLRLAVAYVFLYAAWKNTESASAWAWTKGETEVLFRKVPADLGKRLTAPCAVAGMVMMYGGGISILLGVEPVLGGAALALFSALGMLIHYTRQQEAEAAARAGDAMGASAFSAHLAAGLKNVALIGAAVFFVFAGTGHLTLSDRLGSFFGR